MPKTVLGNDPFKALGQSPESPKKDEKQPDKGKKSARTADKKKSTRKKPSKKPVGKKTKSISKPSATKAAAKKAPRKRTSAKPKVKPAGKAKAKPSGGAKAEAKVSKPAGSRDRNAFTAVAGMPEPPHPAQAPSRTKAVGGGDPGLLRLLRPENFDLDREYGFDPGFREKMESIVRFFYRFYWRVSVKGTENIPEKGRAVFVANHAGILPFDGQMVANAVMREKGRKIWPLIEDFFYYAPVLGTMLSRMGSVRACQENAQRLLSEEEAVLVFPEGIKGIIKPYKNRYQLQRFGRGGFIKLCLNTGSPVIPVAIIGSEETHPVMGNLSTVAKTLNLPYFPVTPLFPLLGPLGLLPLPSKWTIIFGEALSIKIEDMEAATDRMAINRLSTEVKSHIQKMIDVEIGQRGSRWW